MNEITLNESEFASKAECVDWLSRELGKRGFAKDDGNLAQLAEASEPLRIVVHRRGLAPVEEVDAMESIGHAAECADAASAAADAGLAWFDQISAQLEQLAHGNDALDVIVYFDDLAQDEADLDAHVSASEALDQLKRGNRSFLDARHNNGVIASERVRELFEGGQRPYAVVIACSDSRVVPEHMFMAGLGELFVIRVAGNVVGGIELASALYACEHLHSKLLLVLGHTHCGAIESAMQRADESEPHGSHRAESELAARNERTTNPIDVITGSIREAIEGERDPYVASVLNVRKSMGTLEQCPEIAHLASHEGLEIHGAVYHTHSGVVDFLPKA